MPPNVLFAYTGGLQTCAVPASVTRLSVNRAGAGGGHILSISTGQGLGGRVQATLAAVPGQVLTIYGGGAGAPAGAGYNGGGTGYSGSGYGGESGASNPYAEQIGCWPNANRTPKNQRFGRGAEPCQRLAGPGRARPGAETRPGPAG